jgi:hypothetical protein
MHEIITLQFGHQSNYLGTHFWNTQESYFTYAGEEESPVDHNIHWRPGLGSDGSETFLPRTLIYDLKGAFGTLRKTNALYDTVRSEKNQLHVWNEKTSVHKQDPITESSYQQSLNSGLQPPKLTSKDVRFWADFGRTFFHPRSIVQLCEYEFNSSIQPFESWVAGRDLFESLDKDEDLLDRDLRPFIEECDNLQAIQLFTTMDDAWGGFSSTYIERIRDEYGKSAIWTWGMRDSPQGDKVRMAGQDPLQLAVCGIDTE